MSVTKILLFVLDRKILSQGQDNAHIADVYFLFFNSKGNFYFLIYKETEIAYLVVYLQANNEFLFLKWLSTNQDSRTSHNA